MGGEENVYDGTHLAECSNKSRTFVERDPKLDSVTVFKGEKARLMAP